LIPGDGETVHHGSVSSTSRVSNKDHQKSKKF